MDWLHCNDCFKQPHLNPDTNFVLTSCGRLQCSSCNAKNSCSRKDCQSCRLESAVPLNDKMPSAVEEYFCNPLDHVKLFVKVYEFQRGHRDRLAKHIAVTQKEVLTRSIQWQKTAEKMQNEIERYKSELDTLRKEVTEQKIRNQQLEMQLLSRQAHNSRPTEMETDYRLNASRTSSANGSERINNNNHNGVKATPLLNLQPRKYPAEHLANKKMFPPPQPSAMERPGAIRNNRTSHAQHQQKHDKGRTTQFLNVETPAYFPSYRAGPPSIVTNNKNNQNNGHVARQPSVMLPTPTLYKSRPLMASTGHLAQPQAPAGRRPQLSSQRESQQDGLPYNRVHAFMAAAANEALTPEVKSKGN